MEQDDNAHTQNNGDQPGPSTPAGSARVDSLVVAAFPWEHGGIAMANSLADVVGPDQFCAVSDVMRVRRLLILG